MENINEEIKANGLTLKTLIFSLFFAVIAGFAANTGNTAYNHYYAGQSGIMGYDHIISDFSQLFLYGFGLLVIAISIVAAINRIAGKSVFSRSEVVVMSAIIPLGFLVAGHTASYYFPFGSGAANIFYPGHVIYLLGEGYWKYYEYWSPVLGPNYPEAWEILGYSTWNIDWSVWGSRAFVMGLGSLSFVLMFLFLSLLLKEVYIEYERNPFPTAKLIVNMVDFTQPKNTGKSHKWFLIGLAIMILITVPTHWGGLFTGTFNSSARGPSWWPVGSLPGGADRKPIYFWPMAELTEELWSGPYIGYIIDLTPAVIGWFLLMPLEEITGAVASSIIFWVIMPIVANGIGLEAPYQIGPAMHYFHIWETYLTHPGGPYNYLVLGMCLALAIWPLLKARAIFGKVMRAIWSQVPAEMEERMPISYRVTWLGFFACLVVLIAIFAAAGVNLALLLVTVPLSIITSMGLLKVYTVTGGYFGLTYGIERGWSPMNSIAAISLYNFVPMGSTDNVTTSAFSTYLFVNYGEMNCWTNGGQIWSGTWLDRFKVGEEQKMNVKTVFKAIIIGAVAFAVILAIARILLYHVSIATIPGSNLYNRLSTNWHITATIDTYIPTATGDWMVVKEYSQTWISQGIPLWVTGFLIIVVLYLLRDKFTWFRVGVAGFAFGLLGTGHFHWITFIVTLIIKYLALKIGGPRLINERLNPLIFGLVAGWAVGMFGMGLLEFLAFWQNWPTG